MSYFPDLPQQTEEEGYEVVREGDKLPENGLIASLVEKKKEVQLFQTIKRRGKKLLMRGRRKGKEGKYNEMGEVGNEKFIKKLYTENLIVQTSN